jgi:magnesium-transporting ATPase (P-type)
MATVHEPNMANDGNRYTGKYVAHVKGAPDRMIKMCKYQAKAGILGEEHQEPINMQYWTEKIAVLSSHGLWVLALCRGAVEKTEIKQGEALKPEFVSGRDPWLTIVGLCAIMDPPRTECVDAIAQAHKAGVRVAMITGDHKDTALAIGTQLGLVDKKYSEAITGPELDAMSDEELRRATQKYNVFARASPQNKIQIVKALQAEGDVCSMTGDGVNDAPALKAADMGVAMGKEGTDVAREASEMILADDNFATIIYAVSEGRTLWDNLRKVLMISTPINNVWYHLWSRVFSLDRHSSVVL